MVLIFILTGHAKNILRFAHPVSLFFRIHKPTLHPSPIPSSTKQDAFCISLAEACIAVHTTIVPGSLFRAGAGSFFALLSMPPWLSFLYCPF